MFASSLSPFILDGIQARWWAILTMQLRASPRNVRATREKRPEPFPHNFIKQSHPSNRTFTWQRIEGLSNICLYYFGSLLHASYLYPFTPAYNTSYLSGWILYMSIDKYFKHKRYTNTSCYRTMNYNQKPGEHFRKSSSTLHVTQRLQQPEICKVPV